MARDKNNTKEAPKKASRLTKAANAPKRERRSLKEYFKGVRLEMKKVVWPTRKELSSYTAVVLVLCAFFALAFWIIDSGFLAILKGLLGITM
jgi:preprotein translocase subunit SecE